jgi:hypothetical protein
LWFSRKERKEAKEFKYKKTKNISYKINLQTTF